MDSDVLGRYSLLQTDELALAQQATSGFWPAHDSEVVGPETYCLVMNRVLLRQVAITYVQCTARVRVTPREPCQHACLVMPLEGEIELENDRSVFRATKARPLFQAAGWLRRFEASPARCLMIDMLTAGIEEAAADAGHTLPSSLAYTPVTGPHAAILRRHVMALASRANASPRVASLQTLGEATRRNLLSQAMSSREHAPLAAVAAALCDAGKQEPASIVTPDAAHVEAWLAEHAFSSLSLAALTQQAGMTMRTVQRTCERNGFTPQAFLRSVRLDRAREMLMLAEPEVAIADVAAAICIPHVGRFSQYYRERFGELPSDTLIAARRRRERQSSP